MSLSTLHADALYSVSTFLTSGDVCNLGQCSRAFSHQFLKGSDLATRIWKHLFIKFISEQHVPETDYYDAYRKAISIPRGYLTSDCLQMYIDSGHEKLFLRHYLICSDIYTKESALNRAIVRGHLDLVIQHKYAGYFIGRSSVMDAIRNGHNNVAEYYLRNSGSINTYTVDRITALLADKGFFELLDLCLSRGTQCYDRIAASAITQNRHDILDQMLQREIVDYHIVFQAAIEKKDTALLARILNHFRPQDGDDWWSLLSSLLFVAIEMNALDCLQTLLAHSSVIYPEWTPEQIK